MSVSSQCDSDKADVARAAIPIAALLFAPTTFRIFMIAAMSLASPAAVTAFVGWLLGVSIG